MTVTDTSKVRMEVATSRLELEGHLAMLVADLGASESEMLRRAQEGTLSPVEMTMLDDVEAYRWLLSEWEPQSD